MHDHYSVALDRDTGQLPFPALLQIPCVTLAQSLSLSVSQLAHPCDGDNSPALLPTGLAGVNTLTTVKRHNTTVPPSTADLPRFRQGCKILSPSSRRPLLCTWPCRVSGLPLHGLHNTALSSRRPSCAGSLPSPSPGEFSPARPPVLRLTSD